MPESSSARYLHEQLTLSQVKYAYFLLAAAGAAIGLAVNKTADSPLTASHLLLGAAVGCFGLSFYAGCRYVQWANATLRANMALAMIEDGSHPGIPPHPDYWRAAHEGVRSAADTNSEKTAVHAAQQFRLLVAGAALFVIWHVLEMALRTPGLMPG